MMDQNHQVVSLVEMNFDDLTPMEVSVRYRGKKYILREPTEGAICQWRNHTMKSARISEGKVTGLEGAADGDPLLVSLCMVEVVASGSDRVVERPVPVGVVRGWPSRVVKPLFEKLKEMGGLNEEMGSESEESLLKRITEIEDVLSTRVAGLKERVSKLREDGAASNETEGEVEAKNG